MIVYSPISAGGGNADHTAAEQHQIRSFEPRLAHFPHRRAHARKPSRASARTRGSLVLLCLFLELLLLRDYIGTPPMANGVSASNQVVTDIAAQTRCGATISRCIWSAVG